MDLPVALFIGVSQNPVDLIQGITSNPDIQLNVLPNEDHIDNVKYTLDNKYYSSDIMLSVLKQKVVTSVNFSQNVEAVIFYLDTSKENCLAELESWLPYVSDYNTSIEMVVCRNFPNGTTRAEVVKWCLDQGYELVELELSEDDVPDEDKEEEDDFARDIFGMDRITQALNAHVWPNLVRKDRKEPTSFSSLRSGGDKHEAVLDNLHLGDAVDPGTEQKISMLLGGGDPDLDFCELFQELSSMKEKISNLPSEHRKLCAERIALAFYKNMGLDDEDDEDEATSQ